jgi:hypothetical protein
MAENPGSLRRHAEHCRSLTSDGTSERLRAILLTMAAEFDAQAALIEGATPSVILPKP